MQNNMRLYLFIIALFFCFKSQAQWPEFNRAHPVSCQWPPYNYNSAGAFENVFIVDTNPDWYDGYLAFGKGVLCNPGTNSNVWRVFSSKISVNGELLFQARYDTVGIDRSQAWSNVYGSWWTGGMIMNEERDIVTTLTSRDNSAGYEADINYLITIGFLGEVKSKYVIDSLASRYYGFTSLLEEIEDSAYILTGYYMGPENPNPEGSGMLMKINRTGGIIWQTNIVDSEGTFSSIKSMDGGYWIIAQTLVLNECTNNNFLNTDILLVKTDSLGLEEGRFTIGGACSFENASLIETEQDRVVLIGRSTEESTDESFPFKGYLFSTLVEQNESGELIETSEAKKYLYTKDGHFVDLHKSSGGRYLVVCDNQLTPSQGSGPQGRWLGGILALSPERDSLWFRSYSYFNNFPIEVGTRPAYHYILDSKPTSDRGMVLCGHIRQNAGDPNNGLETPWIFKVDSMGCLEPGCQYVNVEEIVVGLENTISVFPNPANDVVNLSFTFPENYVPNNQNEIVIIDMQGREVLRENIFLFASSSNTIEINISSLSSGMYTLHWLSNNAWLDSSKIIVE